MADLLRRDPAVVYLHQLLDELRTGQLSMPRFQRPFVWDDTQQLELLRSVRDGIPMGSILVWETERDIPSFDHIGPHRVTGLDGRRSQGMRRFVLDGTQRLTTLLSALVRPDPELVQREQAPTRFAYDLDQEDFVPIPEGSESGGPRQVPTATLMDDLALLEWMERAREQKVGADQLKSLRVVSRAFSAYKVPVITFTGGDLDTATRIFHRVNRQGTSMSDLHMINALMWRGDGQPVELLRKVEELRRSLAGAGWSGLDPEAILRAAQLLLGLDAQDDPDRVVECLRLQPAALDRACGGFHLVASILRDGANLYSPRLLPYDIQAVLLAAVSAEEPERAMAQRDRLVAWFWLTTYWRTLFGRPKVRPIYRHLLAVLRGEPAEWPQRKSGAYEPLPGALKGFSARVRSLGLLLARQDPLDAAGRSFGGPATFAEHGADALHRLIPSLPRARSRDEDGSEDGPPSLASAGNRVLAPPHRIGELRERLLGNVPASPELLRSHLIDEVAAEALAMGDYPAFIAARERTIRVEEERLESWARAEFFKS